MKDLQSGAQSAIEYGVVVLLLVIRIHQANLVKSKKLMEKPSRELCTYVMNQCKARYDMQ